MMLFLFVSGQSMYNFVPRVRSLSCISRDDGGLPCANMFGHGPGISEVCTSFPSFHPVASSLQLEP